MWSVDTLCRHGMIPTHSCTPYRYGMTPLMDPFQMRIIKSVFNDSMLTVWNMHCVDKDRDSFSKVRSLNMQTCCQGRRWKSVMAFKVGWLILRYVEPDLICAQMTANHITARQKNGSGNWTFRQVFHEPWLLFKVSKSSWDITDQNVDISSYISKKYFQKLYGVSRKAHYASILVQRLAGSIIWG